MRRDVRVERVYPHPRALVWRALTEPELLAEWLMENDFRAEKGHRFTFRTDPQPGFDGVVRCEVLDLVPLERLRISWRGGSIDTVVTFDLADAILFARPGTRLVIEHTGFEGVPAVLTSFILGAGWASMVKRKIEPLLDRLRASARACDVDPRATGGAPEGAAPEEPHGSPRRLWWWLAKAFSPILRRAERRRRPR